MPGARSALIIGGDSYSDPGLSRLRAPASDAQALAGVLEDPAIGGFSVRTLMNEPAHVVSLAVEEFFADRAADDLLLLHFPATGSRTRTASFTSRWRTPCCGGWPRPRCPPTSSTGG